MGWSLLSWSSIQLLGTIGLSAPLHDMFFKTHQEDKIPSFQTFSFDLEQFSPACFPEFPCWMCGWSVIWSQGQLSRNIVNTLGYEQQIQLYMPTIKMPTISSLSTIRCQMPTSRCQLVCRGWGIYPALGFPLYSSCQRSINYRIQAKNHGTRAEGRGALQ